MKILDQRTSSRIDSYFEGFEKERTWVGVLDILMIYEQLSRERERERWWTRPCDAGRTLLYTRLQQARHMTDSLFT